MKSYEELGYNQFLIKKSVEEEQEKAFKYRQEQDLKEREQRESLKIQRMHGKNSLIYMLEKIIEASLVDKVERLQLDSDYLCIPDDHRDVVRAHKFFNELKNYGCFAAVERGSYGRFVFTKPNIGKLQQYRGRLARDLINPVVITDSSTILIRHINFDEEKHLLTINNGEKSIVFHSRKNSSKTCIILSFLWDKREEIKGKRTIRKGEFISVTNLRTFTKCPTNGAVYSHIKRLNRRFKKEKVPINIQKKKDEYRLVVKKS